VKKNFIKKISNSKGQAMAEYVLLIMVLSFIFVGLFSKLKGYILNNPDSSLNQTLRFTALQPGFKFFSVRR
jgi:hypothetical protein